MGVIKEILREMWEEAKDIVFWYAHGCKKYRDSKKEL